MAIELKVPEVGESITEGMISEWMVGEGDFVAQDDTVVVIETDKVDVDVPAPESGILKKILKQEGDSVEVGEVIGELEPEEESAEAKDDAEKAEKKDDEKRDDEKNGGEKEDEKKAAEKDDGDEEDGDDGDDEEPRITPAARRALADAGLDAAEVEATGPGGRLLKEDVERHVKEQGGKDESKEERGERGKSEDKREKDARKGASKSAPKKAAPPAGARQEEAVKLTPLRKRVAERLVEAQHNAAMLTTFNEIDMSRVIALRKQYQDAFTSKYGIKLGFMSFFVKAAIEALKEIPGVNAELRGDEIIYRNYYDVGIAVGGGRGLVVPVIRNAERLSFAETEKTIADLGQRARDNKLKLEELEGGTFTLSNGGIYGSLLSTPILNPPQSGILGMHKIEERPIAKDGEVVIRPMMYVALTYDHRIIDGREAVTFLVRLKEGIEDPTRILLEV